MNEIRLYWTDLTTDKQMELTELVRDKINEEHKNLNGDEIEEIVDDYINRNFFGTIEL